MAYGNNRPVAVNDGGNYGPSGSRFSQLADYARQQADKYWAEVEERERQRMQQERENRPAPQDNFTNIVNTAPEPEQEEEQPPVIQTPQYEEPEQEVNTPIVQPVTQKTEDTTSVLTPDTKQNTQQSALPNLLVPRINPNDKSKQFATPKVPTPAETYNEWEEFVRQQELAEQNNDDLFRQSLEQAPDQSALGNGYVHPVGQIGNTYWNGLQRNTGGRSTYQPTELDQAIGAAVNQGLSNIGNSVLDTLQSGETPAWLDTSNIVDTRNFQKPAYQETDLDRAVRDSLSQLPEALQNAVVDSLNNQQTPEWANAETIVANRNRKPEPYVPTDLDATVENLVKNLPRAVKDQIVESLAEGTTNVNAQSAEQLIQNRNRDVAPYEETDLDKAVKDYILGNITNSLNDTESNDALAQRMGVQSIIDNRTQPETSKFVNEDFNNAVRSIFIPESNNDSPTVNAEDLLYRQDYSDDDIYKAIMFMRNDLGIRDYDPVSEREYALQLLQDGVVPNTGHSPEIINGVSDADYARHIGPYPLVLSERENSGEPEPTWRDNLGWGEDRVNLGNDVMGQFDELFADENPSPGFFTKAEMSARNKVNSALDTLDANAARNNWVQDQMRQNIDINQMSNAEVQTAMQNYYKQYDDMVANGEIETPEQRPLVTSNEITERKKQAYDRKSQQIAETADWTRDLLQTEPTREDELFTEATEAADKAGIKFGTREYWDAVENYVDNENTQREDAILRSRERQNQDLIDTLVETGVPEQQAERMVENPNQTGWNYETNRPTYTGPRADSALSWEDAVGSDRLMEDLMQMSAPAVGKDGKLNTAAQALFDDRLTTEQKLHLFDKGGTFFDPTSMVNIKPEFADLIATDPARAAGTKTPALAQSVNLTEEQFAEMFDQFLKENPLIASMYDNGILTLEDIQNNFFKNVNFGSGTGTGTGYGYGSGSYIPRGGYGYGGGGYYGYGGGKSKSKGWIDQSQAAQKKQTEQRINNIMKNWSF